MSISPPSDIVLDVARAADPLRYREAAARLGTTSSASGPAFQSALAAETPRSSPARAAPVAVPRTGGEAEPGTRAEKANRDFEAMILANLLEAAMPDEGAALFGEGTAGSVWKSMLVEQIAGQMAKSGGIGIAAQLARGAQTALLGDKADASVGREAAKTILIDKVQRGFVGTPGAGTTKVKL